MKQVANHVPELMTAVRKITVAYLAGNYSSTKEIGAVVQALYDDKRLAAIDGKVPGWQHAGNMQTAFWNLS